MADGLDCSRFVEESYTENRKEAATLLAARIGPATKWPSTRSGSFPTLRACEHSFSASIKLRSESILDRTIQK
jgi:hypothetical protein